MEEKNLPTLSPYASALVRQAGLQRALAQFPEDVAIALQTAAQARSAISPPEDMATEPWPPMRMRSVT